MSHIVTKVTCKQVYVFLDYHIITLADATTTQTGTTSQCHIFVTTVTIVRNVTFMCTMSRENGREHVTFCRSLFLFVRI